MSEQHGGYGPGPADGQSRGHDDGYRGFAAPGGAEGSYVPEPLPAPQPPYAAQATPFGAPPPGDDWSPHTTAGPWAGPPQGPYDPGFSGAPGHEGQPGHAASYDAGFSGAPGYEGQPGHAASYDPGFSGTPGYEGQADHAASYDAGFSAAAGHAVPGYEGQPDRAAPYDAGFGAVPGYGGRTEHAGSYDAGLGGTPGHEGQADHAASYDAGFSAAAGHAVPGYEGQPDRAAPYDAGFGAVPGYEGRTDHAAPYDAGLGGMPAGHAAQWPQAHAYAGDGGPQPEAAERRSAPAAGAGEKAGSPLIAPGVRPAGLTAVLGVLLAGGAAVGEPGLTAVLVVLQAVTAAGWFRLNGMWPARQGIALAFLGGVAADAAVLGADGGHAPEAVVGALGIWLLLVLVLQLRHHGSADERLSSLTATSASTVVTLLACGYLAALVSDAGQDPVVVGAVAVAAAAVVRALPVPGGEPASLVAALVAAAATGAATGHAGDLGGGKGVLLALACGVCALVGLRVASYDFPSRFVHFTAGVALPLTAAAPVVYALGRALT